MHIPLVGASVKSYSRDANYQVCMNMYPIVIGPGGRAPSILIPSPGIKQIEDLVGDSVRGIAKISNSITDIYVVVDENLYKVVVNILTETATSTLLGTLQTSTGTVKFSSNPTQLILVDGVAGYIVTLATGVFAQIADTDFPNSSAILFFDSYFVGNTPGTGKIQTSDPNDGTSWNALNVATAENRPDNVVGLAQSRGEVIVIGTESLEVWDDTGNSPGLPFSPRVGGAITQGSRSPYSIVEVNETVVFLDDRLYVVQLGVSDYVKDQSSGYTLTILSTEEINNEFASYKNTADAIAFSYVHNGHIFYQITFPTDRKTWVYDLTVKAWSERGYYSDYYNNFIEHQAQYGVNLGTAVIVGGVNSGKLYLLSQKYYSDAGDLIHRVRSCGPISFDGKWVTIDEIRLRIETGRALSNGYGSDPQIILRYSIDGGHTWSNELIRPLGKIGQDALPITWSCLGTAREWIFEFTITAPINFSFIEAVAEISMENKTLEKLYTQGEP